MWTLYNAICTIIALITLISAYRKVSSKDREIKEVTSLLRAHYHGLDHVRR